MAGRGGAAILQPQLKVLGLEDVEDEVERRVQERLLELGEQAARGGWSEDKDGTASGHGRGSLQGTSFHREDREPYHGWPSGITVTPAQTLSTE